MQIIKLIYKDGIYSCNMNITKQEWLKILTDKNTSVEFKESIIHFYYMPERNYTYLAAIKKEDYHVLELVTEEDKYSYNDEETQNSKSGMEFTEAIEEYLRFYPTNETKSEMKKNNKYDKYIELLKANKNFILTGAPGTGKTYLAKEIAKQLILSKVLVYDEFANDADYKRSGDLERACKSILKNHCMMVQFHPSYDYTDFVEGLRPIKNNNDQLGFERQNGVFKFFCEQSLKLFLYRSKNNGTVFNSCYPSTDYGLSIYEDCYNAAIDEIKKYGFLCVKGIKYNDFSVNREIVYNKNNWEDNIHTSSYLFTELTSWMDFDYDRGCFNTELPSISPSRSDIEKRINEWRPFKDDPLMGKMVTKICSDEDVKVMAEFYSILFDWIIEYAKSNYDKVYLPTVFIIDEINRGEISKIFGELFFSIDPGYRGEFDSNGNDNKVKTQYQGMIEEGDVFKDGFYVPENVYIIGTMNDIDRSVESMDFAMHRRFAFEEVTAEESYQNIIAESNDFSEDEKNEIKKRMFALNDAILDPDLGLGAAYQIGAAYFLKYLNYKKHGMKQAFAMLWNYHLKGLLSEYLRGNHNSKAQLEALKEAYDNKIIKHEESNQDNG